MHNLHFKLVNYVNIFSHQQTFFFIRIVPKCLKYVEGLLIFALYLKINGLIMKCVCILSTKSFVIKNVFKGNDLAAVTKFTFLIDLYLKAVMLISFCFPNVELIVAADSWAAANSLTLSDNKYTILLLVELYTKELSGSKQWLEQHFMFGVLWKAKFFHLNSFAFLKLLQSSSFWWHTSVVENNKKRRFKQFYAVASVTFFFLKD